MVPGAELSIRPVREPLHKTVAREKLGKKAWKEREKTVRAF